MGQRQPSLSGNLSDNASQTALRAFRRSPLRVCGRPLNCRTSHAVRHWSTPTHSRSFSPVCSVRWRSLVSARSSPCSAPSGVPHHRSLISSCLHPWRGESSWGSRCFFVVFYLDVVCCIFLVLTRRVGSNIFVNTLIGCLGEQFLNIKVPFKNGGKMKWNVPNNGTITKKF